jgi:hypothetical protein
MGPPCSSRIGSARWWRAAAGVLLAAGAWLVMAQPATAAWRLESVPSPQGRTPASLYGVSCTSATACVAVGASDIGLRSRAPLAERWDGRRWSIQPTVSPPAPRGRYTRDAELSGVSCTSRTQCVAVGSYRTGSVTGAPLVEAWNGARWSFVARTRRWTLSAASVSATPKQNVRRAPGAAVNTFAGDPSSTKPDTGCSRPPSG